MGKDDFTLGFLGPSKMPKITKYDYGIWRRIYGDGSRIEKVFSRIMKANPDTTRLCYAYKDTPLQVGGRIVKKKRWYYFKWKKKLIYIKVVHIKDQGENHTCVVHHNLDVALKPLNPELIKVLTSEEEKSDVKLEWEVFEWKRWDI